MKQQPAQMSNPDLHFTLRPANRSDQWVIRALVLGNLLIPFNLKWQHFTVAVDRNGTVIGCCQFKTLKDGTCEMASMAVRKRYRLNGIARAIAASMLAQQKKTVWGRTFPKLKALAESLGYKVVKDADVMPPVFRRFLKRNRRFNKISPIKFDPLIIRYDP